MQVLSIDFGLKKVGLAISSGIIAEPFGVLRYKDTSELFKKLEKLIQEEDVEKVIVGVSEGVMAEKSKNFANSLKEKLEIDVKLFDETLTTREAQELSIEAGIGQKRRKKLEDAFAAALILENYLKSNNNV